MIEIDVAPASAGDPSDESRRLESRRHACAKSTSSDPHVILSRRSAAKHLKMRDSGILRSFGVFAPQDDVRTIFFPGGRAAGAVSTLEEFSIFNS